MLVIIEGADKTGKTTLAKALAAKLGWKYEHFSAPGKDPAFEYADFLLNLKRPTVCDRFYVGELVYGPLLRGKSLMTRTQILTIERLCRFRAAILIHAAPKPDIMMDLFDRSSEEEAVTAEQNLKAYRAFKPVMLARHVTTMRYVLPTPSSLKKTIAQLQRQLEVNAIWAKTAARQCSGIGTIAGQKMALVGEKINKRTAWLSVPFSAGPAAEFLHDAMHAAGVDEKQVYLTNADTLTKAEAAFLETDGCCWIALGKQASVVLSDLGRTHTLIPHPQFWNRFRHAKKKEYVNVLRVLWLDFLQW